MAVTVQEFQLGQEVIAGAVYPTLDFFCSTTPEWESGVVKVGTGLNAEWIAVEDLTLVSGVVYRATVFARGLPKDALSYTDGDTDLEKTHSLQTPCTLVTHSVIWNDKAPTGGENTFSGDTVVTGKVTFDSTSVATTRLQSITTEERDSLTLVDTGSILYNSTTQTAQVANNADTFQSFPIGSTNANATETTIGKVGLSSVATQQAGAAGSEVFGDVLQARYLLASASTTKTNDAGKLVKLDTNGKIPYLFLPQRCSMFAGTGEDGAISNTSVTITGSNNSYIVKNYTDFAPGANTVTTTARNSIIHIKVRGNCDLTGTTFDFKGKGPLGGAGGQVSTSGSVGVVGNATCSRTTSVPTGGGRGLVSSADVAGVAATSMGRTFENLGERFITVCCGGSGSGGGGGYTNFYPTPLAYGGDGGAGGGALIIEVSGNIIFSSTTIDIRGNDGEVGDNADSNPLVAVYDASGGGGGGAGGTFLCMYNGTKTGNPTVNLTGGAGGAGGTNPDANAAGYSGSGGAGGSNLFSTGSNGNNGAVGTSPGGAGGAGASGVSLITTNTVFP